MCASRRTKTETDQAGAARAAKARPAAASAQHASQKVKAAKPAAPEEENETMTLELELEAVNEPDLAEQGEDPYQNQQSTPVFVDKNDSFVGKLLDNEHVEVSQFYRG